RGLYAIDGRNRHEVPHSDICTLKPIYRKNNRELVGPRSLSSRTQRGNCSLPEAPAVPSVELAQCPCTLLAVAFLPVANASFERRQEVEGNIRRLKVFALCLRDVVDKRAKRRRSWW